MVHPYGNYIIQTLLEHAPLECRTRLRQVLERHVHLAATECRARVVISKALECAEGDELMSLAHAICGHPDLLPGMACTRHGNTTVMQLLNLDGEVSQDVRRLLLEGLPILKCTR